MTTPIPERRSTPVLERSILGVSIRVDDTTSSTGDESAVVTVDRLAVYVTRGDSSLDLARQLASAVEYGVLAAAGAADRAHGGES